MANTTTEYWDVDGTSLQTYARNISSWGESRQGVPRQRGEDVEIPHRPGRVWVPKVVDSQTITLSGWVIGASDDGVVGDVQTFRSNWRTLKNLLFTPGRQIALTRRWYDGSAKSATGYAEVLDGFFPEMTGGTRATFSVDLFMADPYFYASQVSQALTLNAAATNITVPGDDAARNITISLSGSTLTNGRITCTSATVTTWVQYTTLSGSATLDIDAFSSVEGASKTLSKITHGGAAPWLIIPRGASTLQLTGSGTGSATVYWKPVYV